MTSLRWGDPRWHNRSLLNPRPQDWWGIPTSRVIHPASCDERDTPHNWAPSHLGHECQTCFAVV